MKSRIIISMLFQTKLRVAFSSESGGKSHGYDFQTKIVPRTMTLTTSAEKLMTMLHHYFSPMTLKYYNKENFFLTSYTLKLL